MTALGYWELFVCHLGLGVVIGDQMVSKPCGLQMCGHWTFISPGRMLVLNYLGRKGQDSGLVAAMTFSVSWDPFETSYSLERPLNLLLFNQYLTANMQQFIQRSVQSRGRVRRVI